MKPDIIKISGFNMLNLNSKIEDIHRIGDKTASRLKKIGISTARDLLFYFPFRYDDFRKKTLIKNLVPGIKANIEATIEIIQNKRSHRRRMNITEAVVSDNSEQLKVIWFNQPFIARNLRVGDKVSLTGKVEGDINNPSLISPVYEKTIPGQNIHTQGLIPNYHLTANITQKQLRFLINLVLPLSNSLVNWLPVETIKNTKLINLNQAIKKIHFPQNFNEIREAQQYFGFCELFILQLKAGLIKKSFKNIKSDSIKFKEKDTKKFVQTLPFSLTDDQRKASWQIIKDLEKEKPMARLLEGDVGSGKTLVAMLAMLNVALNKKQSILMVPTEILALQHFNSFSNFFSKTSIKIAILTRTEKRISHQNKISNISKEKLTKKVKTQNVDIIIGTHALVQESIEYSSLSLVVIDEQHRFGVEQRKILIKKSGAPLTIPHLLSMTATPIPRSLALAVYGELDITIIKELPRGRKPIITRVVDEKNRPQSYQFIKKQINSGRQIFVICPLIDISDKTGMKSVKEEYKKLNNHIFPNLNIAMLHGRLKAQEKEQTMQDFLKRKIDILVSTSVIEVGVDVPNASIMIIEGADRFGLAQLHQFRGRVGRGAHQSYCFLFSQNDSINTKKRMQAMVKHNDGFSLAKIDLELRGPGEVYGTAQKGFPELKFASLSDSESIKIAKSEADKILKKSPKLNKYPLIKQKISDFETQIHLE